MSTQVFLAQTIAPDPGRPRESGKEHWEREEEARRGRALLLTVVA